MVTRKKFQFFIKCSKSVLLIQNLYKLRYKRMNEKAKKIQEYYKKKKEERAERDKIILKKKLELQKEKYSYLDVDKIMDKMLSNKDGKDLHNMIVNLGTEKDEIAKMRKQKIIQKDVTRDLMHETNPDTIVDLILYSRLPEETKANRKKIKRSKSDFYKVEDKLIYEGKLLNQKREKLRKIKEEEEENSKIPEYIPKFSKKNEMIMKKYPDNFLKRVEYFQLFKKRNLENLRNKNYLEITNELRFEPKINNDIYNDVPSKFFNLYNAEKTKENENRININNKVDINLSSNEKDTEKKDFRDVNLKGSNQNYRNINEIKNIKLMNNNKDIKNAGKIKANYTNLEIWPKNMKNKYLNPEKFESEKDDE